MVILQGSWFDGKTSARLIVEVRVNSLGHVDVVHTAENCILQSCAFSDVRVSSRLGNTSRYLYFPGGEKFETLNNNAIDQLLHQYRPALLNTLAYQLESHIYFVGITLLIVIALAWGGVTYGLPAASKSIAYRLPQQVMDRAAQETLSLLDKIHLQPSKLEQQQQDRLLAHFAGILAEYAYLHPRVLFREGGVMGANAFALPDGTIVFTDEMVRLAKSDDELLAVMAHEIGHIKYRHSLRSAIQGTSIGFLVSMLTGDLSAASGVLTALPVILTTMAYSRDFEREADQNALDYLIAQHIDPLNFATLMERVTYESHCNSLLSNREIAREKNKETSSEAGPETDNHSTENTGSSAPPTKVKAKLEVEAEIEEPILTAGRSAARKAECDRLIEEDKAQKSHIMDYFSTHPGTAERLQKFRRAN